MNHEAFLSLIIPLQERLFRYAFHLLQDENEAKDVIQDVLIKIWEKRADLAKLESIEAWCIQVTKNTILDRLKSKNYRMTEELNVDRLSHLPGYGHARETELSSSVDLIRGIIDSLPEKHKSFIQLRDIEGYSYNEIAEIMDLNVGEVKIGIFRARQAVRQKLQNFDFYGD